ncbi:efflux RND transporter periplasmic adaptor subunit [Parapedobacter tibetensis]|uniref:efflux RND transporter periplasmic adaptor subunit n=1 Tax=Parapedobacter tibetensis TaxID=2972951 RepID=UPI00214DE561|nr:efflux RND transporter periplasmic adaptor subunit [Parapedobacter tibetensis]
MKAKAKKIALYLAIALGGLLVGWLIFGRTEKEGQEEHQHATGQETTYTCSMHPQIRQNEPGNCPICGMELIPVSDSGNGEGNPYVLQMTEEAVALANIQTTRVKGISGGSGLVLSGKIKVNEEKRSVITAKFPGRIEQLYVNFTGQDIRKGDRLATIYSPELVSAQQELREAASIKDRAPELYAAAKEKLKLWKLSESQIQKIESSQEVVSSFDIYSDVGGVVTERLVAQGDYVNTGSALAQVADLSNVWIVLDAYESDLSELKIGAPLKFTAQGIPGKQFETKVNYITPMLDGATRTVEVRAVAANPGYALKPEMFVNAVVGGSDKAAKAPRATTILGVPKTAVLWTGPRSVVYVKVPGAETPAFEMREVTLGSRSGEMFIIQSGLDVGEEVVSNGVFAIDGAAQLSGNYSMMTRGNAKTLDVPQAFRKQITQIAEAYFALKNALVKDDANAAMKTVGTIKTVLNSVDMGLLTDDNAHHQWMEQQTGLEGDLKKLSGIAKPDIASLRAQFEPLSNHIIEMTETFGLEIDKVYKQFCPMAFDDKGAYWLSETEPILNPYFGEAMLNCGEVKQTYRKGQRVLEKGDAQQQPEGTHNH